jgi:hypothetical protein
MLEHAMHAMVTFTTEWTYMTVYWDHEGEAEDIEKCIYV